MKTVFIVWIVFILTLPGFSQESWTHFRGNQLDGHAGKGTFCIHFSEDTNLVWKTEIPGLGWSSPVVWENQIWLTTATRSGDSLSAICLDFSSGLITKKMLLFMPEHIQNINSTNSYATPTPAIEKGFVYVNYGTYGTACINTDDYSVVWSRTDLNCDHMQGAASSLFLYHNLLIVHVEGTDVQYIAALDKTTGKTVWKTDRPHEFYKDIAPVYRKAYVTPVIVNVDGRDQLISNGAQMCIAYDPASGREIWSVWYGYDSTVGMPLSYGGLVYFNSGWVNPENASRYVRFFAVDPRGKGDVTQTHVKWETDQDVPQISTPVIAGDRIYMIHERGMLTCRDAMTGKVMWKNKLNGQFNASPVYAGGNIYFPDVSGKVFVIASGDSFHLLGENKLDGMIKATPAFLNGNIILRTNSHLYRIGK
jgi:outer membrane protein assembly factor BamB